MSIVNCKARSWMRPPFSVLCLIVLATLTGRARGGLTHSSKVDRKFGVEHWKPDQLHRFIEEHPVTAVLFYSAWSVESQQLLPQWDLASQKLELHDPPVPLVRASCHLTTDRVAERFNVTSLPKIKLYMGDFVEEFTSDASSFASWQQIVKWVSRHLDSSHVLRKADDVDPYLNDNDLNVVGLYPDGMDSSVFATVAGKFQDMIFAEARGSAISAEVGRHLARHASLACETVDVGTRSGNSKSVPLPRAGMECSSVPRNPQHPDWSDRFDASVSGTQLTVRRLDQSGGWKQLLQLRCCDPENASGASAIGEILAPSIVMFMPHDEGFARYDGALDDSKAMDRWIAGRHWPMVMRFTEDTMGGILSDSYPKRPPLILMYGTDTPGRLGDVMTEVARRLRGTVQVTLCGTKAGVEQRLIDLVGISEEALPAIVLIDGSGEAGNFHISSKYVLATKDPRATDVEQFVRDFELGRLKRWIRSEAEPEGGPNAEVPGILVGTTFEEYARDERVDVLVTFYAPWCGYCKKFEPQYRQLARKLAHVPSLRVMKLDATRNDVLGVTVSGYPTIALFPARSGRDRKAPEPAFYTGSREEEDLLLRWLHQNCAIDFNETAPALSPEVADIEGPVSGIFDDDEDL